MSGRPCCRDADGRGDREGARQGDRCVASGRMRNRRVTPILALGVGSILFLASCGFGVTGTADEITPISARLHGTVSNTVAGYTPFLFEYGPTEAYGSIAGETTYIPTAGGSQEEFQP